MTKKFVPNKAFVMAAGFGTRMRPLTLSVPKPLVEINSRTLLDYILDHLNASGVRDVVVNAHYLADKICAYASARADMNVGVSVEDEILDTGGGLFKVIDQFDGEPFIVINGDSFWVNSAHDFQSDLITNMSDAWDDEEMDILIALQPVSSMELTQGVGDYFIESDGRARRALDKNGTHMFTSVRINHPRIFDGAPSGAFSYLQLLDQAQQAGRLYAYEHKGDWHHISTPEDLNRVEEALF